MKLARAIDVAKSKGFTLQWNENFKVYDLIPAGRAMAEVHVHDPDIVSIRPSWLAIIEEAEFIRDFCITVGV